MGYLGVRMWSVSCISGLDVEDFLWYSDGWWWWSSEKGGSTVSSSSVIIHRHIVDGGTLY